MGRGCMSWLLGTSLFAFINLMLISSFLGTKHCEIIFSVEVQQSGIRAFYTSSWPGTSNPIGTLEVNSDLSFHFELFLIFLGNSA